MLVRPIRALLVCSTPYRVVVTKVDRPLLSMDSRQRVSAADYCAHREDYAEDEKTCWDSGMNDFMRKPINYGADGRRGAEGSHRGTLHETDARHQQLQSTLAANDPNRAAKELNALCGTY